MLHIHQFPVLKDNYTFILRDEGQGVTAVVDPAEAPPVLEFLAARGWKLDWIWNTHHHGDHVGGNRELAAATGCGIMGYAGDAARIPGITRQVQDGESVALGGSGAQLLFLPGHTLGHIAYYFPSENALFSGDVLFGMGCGRLFEGTPEQMWHSLQRIMALPDETRIYCAHEYTLANGEFALSMEPGNPALQARMQNVRKARQEGLATVPLTLGEEKATNPFLRPHSREIRQQLAMQDANDAAIFAALRRRKDSW